MREFGLRNATVLVDYAGRNTEWRVPALTVGLMHGRSRSVITGRATVAAAGGKPWEITFETDESERNRTLTLKTSVSKLVPRTIAGTVPELSLLQALDLPIDGQATMELTSDGDVRAATLAIGLGHGNLRLPALPEAPLEVDGGSIKLAYDGIAEKVTLAPSTLSWRGSRVTISGRAEADDPKAEHPAWKYQLSSSNGSFAAEEFNATPVALDEWRASGTVLPHSGAIELGEFKLRAGGAQIDMTGSLVTGSEPASTRLEGTLGPMSLNTLKALWPKAIAPGAREWVGERVDRGSVFGGKFRFASGSEMSSGQGVGAKEHQLSFLMDVGDLEMRVIDDLPPIAAPRATTRIENDALEIVIPEAGIILAADRRLPLVDGRFTAVDIMSEVPTGEIVFASQPGLGAVMELIGRARPAFLEETGLPRDGIDGKVDAKFKINLPLLADLPDGSVKIDGKGASHRWPHQADRGKLSGAERQHRFRRHRQGGRRQRPDARQWRLGEAELATHLRCTGGQAATPAPDGDARQHRSQPAWSRRQRHRAGRGADRIDHRERRKQWLDRAPARRPDQRRSHPRGCSLAQAARALGDHSIRHCARQDPQDRAAELQGGRRRHRHRGLGRHRRRQPHARVLFPRLLPQRRDAHGGPGTLGSDDVWKVKARGPTL
ncbi:MAG: hypothetical protein WDN31_20215 [Hyphomicrobium sp.]